MTVALSATDGRGSGVDAIRFTTDGSAPTATSPVYTTPFGVQESTTVNFFATDRAGNAEVVHTQLVQITAASVRISFTWDDGKFSLYNLAWQRALQPHGVRSTFYINSGDVGTGESGPTTPGFMTWANLAELSAAGNEIGGHTVNHLNLVTLPNDASRIHQACDDRQALLLHGLHPTSFAYPEGALSAHVQDIVRGCGYSNARSGGGLTVNGTGVHGDGATGRHVRDAHMGVDERRRDHPRGLAAGGARGLVARRRLAPAPGAHGLLAAVLPLRLRGLPPVLRPHGAHHAERLP